MNRVIKKEVNEVFTLLKQYDSPTICNSLEIIRGGRQNTGFTQRQMVCSELEAVPMIGYAKTAQISGREPTKQSPEEALNLRLDYHKFMADIPKNEAGEIVPYITVIEDLDYPCPIAAFIGEINISVHKALGLKGILTSGLVRDLDVLEKGMPCVASAIGVSHAFVTVKSINTEVDIIGMKVKPGQIVHADKHGAVLIENEEELFALPAAVQQLIAKEKIVIDAAKNASKGTGLNADMLNEAWLKYVNYQHQPPNKSPKQSDKTS